VVVVTVFALSMHHLCLLCVVFLLFFCFVFFLFAKLWSPFSLESPLLCLVHLVYCV
jgi:hypothetical protein